MLVLTTFFSSFAPELKVTAKVDELVGNVKKAFFFHHFKVRKSKLGVFVSGEALRGRGWGYTMRCLGTIHSKEGWIKVLAGLASPAKF